MPGAKRQFGIAIPTWARTHGEDGAALLENWLELAGEILNAMEQDVPPKQKGRAYKVLSLVLADFCERNRELLA